MAGHTWLGHGLWHWEPWTQLDPGARLLWLGLYTTAEAKVRCPGLWSGSIQQMSEVASLSQDIVRDGLDRMIDRRVIEFDQRTSVLRMTMLPDFGEKPYNANVIHGWWNRFGMVRECRVRDAYVPLMKSLCDAGIAAVKSADMKAAMIRAWDVTFATIRIPDPVVRAQRLSDSDTGTRAQPSLFAPSNAVPDLNLGSEEKQEDLNRGGGVGGGVGYPVPHGTGIGIGIGTGIGSGSSFSSPDPDSPDPADRDRARARFELVPPPALAPFSVDDVLEALALRDDVLAGRSRDGLWAEIAMIAEAGMGRLELQLLDRWVRETRMRPRDRCDIVTTPALVNAFSRARQWDEQQRKATDRANEQSREFREAMAIAGLKPLGG